MQLLDNKNTNYSPSENFFIEKSIELLHRKTIDTYRARVHNPRTILQELRALLEDERITSSKAYEYAIIETRDLLSDIDETTLSFNHISKNHFIGLISDLQKTGNHLLRKKIPLVIESLILEKNKDYALNLLKEIDTLITEYDDAGSEAELFSYFNRLSKLTSYFITDLISRKFSKRFLFRIISGLFTSKKKIKFAEGLDEIKNLLSDKPKAYAVIFKIEIPPELSEEIALIQSHNVSVQTDLKEITDVIRVGHKKQRVESFANKGLRNPHFVNIRVDALDPFTALEIARVTLAENLDIIHFGYSNETVYPDKTVLIISQFENGDHYVQQRALDYEMDGAFKNGIELYNSFTKQLSIINQKPEIKRATKEKLKSSIRYLRLGNEAIEVEHKFLNYWIAVEYLFTDLKDKSDINDIKKYFSRLHANIYLKRLLQDFHENILRLRVNKIAGFDINDLKYLESEESYTFIIERLRKDFPLLTHRAAFIKKLLFQKDLENKKTISELEVLIDRHTKDLELHLSRMYRIRNTIIHNAAINMDIISTAANLRYYLTFTIVSLIKELTESSILECIEDVFITQETKYNSLKEGKFEKHTLLSIPTNFDFII